VRVLGASLKSEGRVPVPKAHSKKNGQEAFHRKFDFSLLLNEIIFFFNAALKQLINI